MDKFEVPVPTQEKVGRYVTWGLIGAAVVFGGNLMLPHVNTMVNIVLTAVGLVIVAYGALTLAPMAKQAIDLFAQRATWALINADPVGHLRIWLKEVRADKQEFATQLEGIGQAIATVEASKTAAEDASTKQQQRYNSAMKQGRTDNQSYSVAAGKYGESAKRYEKMLVPLKTLEQELQKLYAVYERE
jgi:hypothetical protein